MINLLKTAFLDALENTDNNPIYNTIRAIQGTLNVKMCTLWSINHNSTNNNESPFNSASLLVRIMTPGLNSPYLRKDEEYVQGLDNCFIEQIIKDVEKRGKNAYWEGTINDFSIHHSYEEFKKMGFSYFICIPIFQHNAAIAFLKLAFFEKPFLENTSKIIDLIRKAIGIAISRYYNNQKQSLINDLIEIKRFSGGQDLNEFCETIVSSIFKKYIDYEGASIFLLNTNSNQYDLFSTTGLENILKKDDIFYLEGKGLTGLAASEKRTIVYDNLIEIERNNPGFHYKYREVTEHKGSTLLIAPIFHPLDSDKVIGIIRFINKVNKQSLSDKRQVIDYFNENDVEFITGALDCIALIIQAYFEKNESKSFCEKVSHDLKGPINSIRSTAFRIQNKKTDEVFMRNQFDRYIQSIVDSANLALMEIQTYLFASQNHTVGRLFNQSVSVNRIITDSINLLRPYAREHNVLLDNIVFHKLSPDRLIMVDIEQFILVFYHLLTNAIKFAKPNSELKVEISSEESNGNLLIRVKDYGIGIEHEDLNNVFLYGFRSPNAKKLCATGNGLGLYVAKEILQAYNCIIRITNNYNPTTFEIEIPNSLFVADINNKESDKSKTILWIDDEINTSSLRPYLDEFGENGVSIVKVKNLDALNHIIDSVWSSLSVIILDIIMPPGENIGLNRAKGGLQTGLIVLENLLNDERLNNVPKIVFSNINVFEIKAFCKKNNIPILRKSDYASDEFIKKVDEIISDYR